jgi:hypothetical protein
MNLVCKLGAACGIAHAHTPTVQQCSRQCAVAVPHGQLDLERNGSIVAQDLKLWREICRNKHARDREMKLLRSLHFKNDEEFQLEEGRGWNCCRV